jgi:CBS-domain-containing membrane protein
MFSVQWISDWVNTKTKTKLRVLSPRTDYTDRRLSTKLVPTFAERGCHVVSVTDPYGRILGFLDRNRYFFFQVAPQLYSRG